jgi:hypothetical protein
MWPWLNDISDLFPTFHEYEFLGFYFSPVALYALLALPVALTVRTLLTRLQIRQRMWAGAWVDLSVYVLCLFTIAVFPGK